MTVLDLLLRPELVEKSWAYFQDVQTKDVKYKPFIRDEPPATHSERRHHGALPSGAAQVLLRPGEVQELPRASSASRTRRSGNSRMWFSAAALATLLSYTWILEPRVPRWCAAVVGGIVLSLAAAHAVRTGEWGFARKASGPGCARPRSPRCPAVIVLLAIGAARGTLHDRNATHDRDRIAGAVGRGAAVDPADRRAARGPARHVAQGRRVWWRPCCSASVHLPNLFLAGMTHMRRARLVRDLRPPSERAAAGALARADDARDPRTRSTARPRAACASAPRTCGSSEKEVNSVQPVEARQENTQPSRAPPRLMRRGSHPLASGPVVEVMMFAVVSLALFLAADEARADVHRVVSARPRAGDHAGPRRLRDGVLRAGAAGAPRRCRGREPLAVEQPDVVATHSEFDGSAQAAPAAPQHFLAPLSDFASRRLDGPATMRAFQKPGGEP
jgi:hypothetical protein